MGVSVHTVLLLSHPSANRQGEEARRSDWVLLVRHQCGALPGKRSLPRRSPGGPLAGKQACMVKFFTVSGRNWDPCNCCYAVGHWPCRRFAFAGYHVVSSGGRVLNMVRQRDAAANSDKTVGLVLGLKIG